MPVWAKTFAAENNKKQVIRKINRNLLKLIRLDLYFFNYYILFLINLKASISKLEWKLLSSIRKVSTSIRFFN